MHRVTVMLVLLTLVGSGPSVSHGTTPPGEDASCSRRTALVSLLPDEPARHPVTGWLCRRSAPDGQTVILASPPGFSAHAYWDWPQDRDTYSFVRAFTQRGYAVFNYDRIGTGESERADAALINLQSEAFVQHQLVEQLRTGALGPRFGSVVLAGNSLSTLIDIFQAEVYQDVDGLINTGIVVGPSPVGLAKLFSALYAAQFDPKYSNGPSIPLGYATTQPGSRDAFFHLPATDPATLALDEVLKDTGTIGEASTFGAWYPFTRLVDVPVLSVIGSHDVLACVSVCEPGGIETVKEQPFWSPATCFEMEIVADAGHFLQLQANSAVPFTQIAHDWLTRRIGVSTSSAPPAPCS